MSLAGKRMFITGGSRGIGLAIALRAAQDGALSLLQPRLPKLIQNYPERFFLRLKKLKPRVALLFLFNAIFVMKHRSKLLLQRRPKLLAALIFWLTMQVQSI